MPQQSEVEVPASAAYEAARDRAVRTTEALILAEARIVALTAQRDRLMQQLVAADEDHWRPTNAGPVEFVCPHRNYDGGVSEDGADDQDPPGYTAAVGQAD